VPASTTTEHSSEVQRSYDSRSDLARRNLRPPREPACQSRSILPFCGERRAGKALLNEKGRPEGALRQARSEWNPGLAPVNRRWRASRHPPHRPELRGLLPWSCLSCLSALRGNASLPSVYRRSATRRSPPNGNIDDCDRNVRRTPQCLLHMCAVRRRRFPVGASPTRRPLQPEATGAVMVVTKWLKPSV
jgi:hypothetical protein